LIGSVSTCIEFNRYEENPDIPRKEINFTLSFEGAIPSRKEIINEISVCYGSPEELVALGKLRAVRRKKKANGSARIYSDRKTMKMSER